MSRNLLTENQQDALTMFMEISQINDEGLCISILANNSWNVDEAVNNFMVGGQSDIIGSSSSSASSSAYRRPNASSSSSGSISNRSAPPASNTDTQRRNVPPPSGNVFDTMLGPIKWLLQIRPHAVNPSLDAQKFITEFDETYSSVNRPTFCNSSYQAAVQQAFQASKFLVVYLHSPLHEDTPKFCRQALCTRNVSMLLNDEAVVWAGSVWDPEAYDLSVQFRVSAFPFMAVLVCPSAREVNICDRVQGYLEERLLDDRLRNSFNANAHALAVVRQTIARRDESAQLRAEQDREYRDLEESTRRESERRAREQRERQEREAEERRQAELEEALELSRRLGRESALIEKKKGLTEPENGPDVATIRFQLPLGAKVSRRFIRSDTVQLLCDFVDVHMSESGSPTTRFTLNTQFPKAQLSDMGVTIEQLGLHPRGMLYVQDLDA